MAVGLGTLLAAIFITLKLTGAVAWSWWFVLAPMWIPAAFVLVGWLVMGAVAWSIVKSVDDA